MREFSRGRRRWQAGAVSFLLSLFALSPLASAQDITTGLQARWKLDETTGTTIYNTVDTKNLTWGGSAAVSSVAGKDRTGLAFDGVDDYATRTNDYSYSAVTVGLWIKPNAAQGCVPFNFYQNSSNGWGLNFFGAGYFSVRDDLTGGDVFMYTVPYEVNAWQHIAVTLDAGTHATKIYVNGVLRGSGLNSSADLTGTAGSFNLGRRFSGAAHCNASFDDVRIYNRSLTAADVAALYKTWEGNVRYNADSRVPEYYDGSAWAGMGPPKPTAKGLIGWWKMDDASGAITDSSPSGNNGTQSGGVTYSKAGVVGKAIGFDGVNDYISVGNPSELQITGDLTITAWARFNSFNAGAEDDHIAVKFDGASTNRSYSLKATDDCGSATIAMQIFTDAAGNAGQRCGATALSTGQYYHVAGVYNAAKQTIDVYLNGVLNNGTVTGSGIPAAIHTSTANFTIGGRSDGAAALLDGDIDDVRVYNRALSAAEIYDIYRTNPGSHIRDGLVHWWPMDETSGTIAYDSVGGVNATYNTNLVPVTGRVDGALNFPTNDDYMSAGVNAAFDIPTGAASLWFYTPNASSGSYRNLFGKDASGTNNGDLSLRISHSGTGTPNVLEFVNENGVTSPLIHSNAAITANEWNHVAINFGTGGMEMYVNGTKQTETNAETVGMMNSAAAFVIGNIRVAGTPDFDGYIDDVRLYNRRLSADDVSMLYQWGMAGGPRCSSPVRYPGAIVYNADAHVMQYCDGANWVPMGAVPGAGGAGCNNPTKAEGTLIYNSDYSIMQYCDGGAWVGVGK